MHPPSKRNWQASDISLVVHTGVAVYFIPRDPGGIKYTIPRIFYLRIFLTPRRIFYPPPDGIYMYYKYPVTPDRFWLEVMVDGYTIDSRLTPCR